MNEQKNPVGRPTLYTDDFGEKIIKYFRKGWAIEEICLKLNIDVQTYYNWKKKHPDFFESIRTGEFFSKGWWIKKGRKALHDKSFNDRVWARNMQNRFGWDKEEVKQDNVPEDIQKDRELAQKCQKI